MGKVKGNHINIAVPQHFKGTWAKFIEICARDGTSASAMIRQYVVGEVTKRDPGNPQRTLGVYTEGHPDELAAKRSDMLKDFIAKAQARGGELRRREVLEALKAQGAVGNLLVELTKSMCEDLKKLGVGIVYR